MTKVTKIFPEGFQSKGKKRRISGNAGFPAPIKKDIGRKVIVKRQCITWDGLLGHFADDKTKETYAFYRGELE